MGTFVKVADISELVPGEKLPLEIDSRYIALFNVDGTIYATDDICTHDGGPLAEGDLEGNEIVCPRHGARFDVRTGKALTMPAFESITSYTVKEEDGSIFIELPGS